MLVLDLFFLRFFLLLAVRVTSFSFFIHLSSSFLFSFALSLSTSEEIKSTKSDTNAEVSERERSKETRGKHFFSFLHQNKKKHQKKATPLSPSISPLFFLLLRRGRIGRVGSGRRRHPPGRRRHLRPVSGRRAASVRRRVKASRRRHAPGVGGHRHPHPGPPGEGRPHAAHSRHRRGRGVRAGHHVRRRRRPDPRGRASQSRRRRRRRERHPAPCRPARPRQPSRRRAALLLLSGLPRPRRRALDGERQHLVAAEQDEPQDPPLRARLLLSLARGEGPVLLAVAEDEVHVSVKGHEAVGGVLFLRGGERRKRGRE
jgi:hypothetical protein